MSALLVTILDAITAVLPPGGRRFVRRVRDRVNYAVLGFVVLMVVLVCGAWLADR